MLKIEDLKIGDILVAGNYGKVVQYIVGAMVFLSHVNNYYGPCEAYTIEQLRHNGYKLKPTYPEFKVDQPLMVRDVKTEPWKRRHFAYFQNGMAWCWCGGHTKWISGEAATPWAYYRLPTPEELGNNDDPNYALSA